MRGKEKKRCAMAARFAAVSLRVVCVLRESGCDYFADFID